MAVYFKDKVEYKGAVLMIDSHYWMDGMLEEWAVCWDKESHGTTNVTFGYYGIDGTNLAGGRAEVDANKETVLDMLRTFKKDAWKEFERSVLEYKSGIRAGSNVEVVRGRKVKKGTKLNVFWIGEKPTYRSQFYDWMNETETIAGCHDENGNKVWIKAEYLKVTDKLSSPNAKERSKFIKNYVKDRAARLNVKIR